MTLGHILARTTVLVFALTSGSIARAAPSFQEAVLTGRQAAKAVLGRTGDTPCLRGKLNRSLLGLSKSCEANGQVNALCSMVEEAVIVSPMNQAFMDTTAQKLLELSPHISQP